MRIRFPILLSAVLLAAAILMTFRDELHARGPRLLNRPAEPVTECASGRHGSRNVLRMTRQLFYCPARRCIAAYALTFRSQAPTEQPQCAECGQPFPATLEGRWLHYLPAGAVVFLAPDTSE
jgi:hypothetical protein